jgi:hypothetical protein
VDGEVGIGVSLEFIVRVDKGLARVVDNRVVQVVEGYELSLLEDSCKQQSQGRGVMLNRSVS